MRAVTLTTQPLSQSMKLFNQNVNTQVATHPVKILRNTGP